MTKHILVISFFNSLLVAPHGHVLNLANRRTRCPPPTSWKVQLILYTLFQVNVYKGHSFISEHGPYWQGFHFFLFWSFKYQRPTYVAKLPLLCWEKIPAKKLYLSLVSFWQFLKISNVQRSLFYRTKRVNI